MCSLGYYALSSRGNSLTGQSRNPGHLNCAVLTVVQYPWGWIRILTLNAFFSLEHIAIITGAVADASHDTAHACGAERLAGFTHNPVPHETSAAGAGDLLASSSPLTGGVVMATVQFRLANLVACHPVSDVARGACACDPVPHETSAAGAGDLLASSSPLTGGVVVANVQFRFANLVACHPVSDIARGTCACDPVPHETSAAGAGDLLASSSPLTGGIVVANVQFRLANLVACHPVSGVARGTCACDLLCVHVPVTNGTGVAVVET